MKEISGSEWKAEVSESKVPVLVDFYNSACQPCKMMMPVLEKLSAEVGDRASVVKIDVEYALQLANKAGVRRVPTFKVYKNGVESWTGVGVQKLEELKKALLEE